MTARIDELRAIYSRLGRVEQFTEPQQQPRGVVRPDDDIDRGVRALVADVRTREGLRTTLSDGDLVGVVRGFYAGRSDHDVAADLDVSTTTVFRARMGLHLFDERDAPPELDPVIRRLRAGESPADVATRLDVSRAAVDRVDRLLAARRAARRVNYRYTTGFADLLDGDSTSVDLDRQVWEDRRALVDAHED